LPHNLCETASNNLRGTIPPEIQHLSKLNFLDLSSNGLSGALPSELKKLTLLKFLHMDANQLTGTIPAWLGNSLGNLKALGLSDNLLHGSLPGSLANSLSNNLKTLSLSRNMLTGDIAILKRMRFLKFLYLNDNEFQGRLDHGLLADMPFLLEADLSNNQLSSKLPEYLFLRKLKILDLSSNQFTGLLPFFGAMSTVASPLEFLSVRNNSLSESIPSGLLTHLRRLTHLDLSFNQFTGHCPQSIGNMTDLSYLFLGNNSLNVAGGTIPNHLQSLTKLRELSLANLNLQGPIPTWFENFADLRLLDLSQNQLIGSIDLDFQKLQNLVFLMLHDNFLSGSLPASLSTLPNLVVLSLHQNDFVDNGIDAGSICRDDSKLELMTVDCGEIDCPCCDECCDSDDCYDGVIWKTLEYSDGDWEERFERSDYSFNPHITMPGKADCGQMCT
jgi:Leucine-rich repeat (LRR) protein